VVYQETDSFATGKLGLFTIPVGLGTPVSGHFDSINWGSSTKFLQVEIDPTGGTSYVNLGANQMLSVPYALYAGNAGGSSPRTALNGLHSAGDTIRLGGVLSDTVTYITLPFNSALVISPDSNDFDSPDYTGIGIARGEFEGDSALAINMAGDFIMMNASRFAQVNVNHGPVYITSVIKYGYEDYSGHEANFGVAQAGPDGNPTAVTGVFAAPFQSRLIARGYTGSEGYFQVDTDKLTAGAPHSIEIATYNPITHGSLEIETDTVNYRSSANLRTKNADFQSSISATPDKCSMILGSTTIEGASNSVYIDTASFTAFLKEGTGMSLYSDRFDVSINGDQLFYVDTTGKISIQDKSSSYYSSLTNTGSLSSNRTYTLPDATGVLPLSVNGQTADASGNIVTTGYTAKNSAYTLTANDYTVDCTSGTFALTLPTAVGSTGKIYVLNNSGTGVITINTTSAQTIDGNSSGTLTLAQNKNYNLQSNGANWIILSAK
jgi:hypothetical protein